MPKAVVGLGNPGSRYARTRHNAGFMVVDRLARAHGVALADGRHQSLWAELRLGDDNVVLVQPQTFMNRSGLAVAGFAAELGLAAADVLVVHDELDLPLARTKLKRGGGTAGHRGLESIVEHLGTREFPRLRVGIGRPAGEREVVDFVLEPFAEAEGGGARVGARRRGDRGRGLVPARNRRCHGAGERGARRAGGPAGDLIRRSLAHGLSGTDLVVTEVSFWEVACVPTRL